MEKRKRCGDDDDEEDLLLPKGLTMEKKKKQRCGDLPTATTTFKFGPFILLAKNEQITSFPVAKHYIEHALFMLSSSGSVEDSSVSRSVEDSSVSGSVEDSSVSRSGSSGGGCLWSTGSNDDDCDDDRMIKVDIDNNNNNNLGGDDDDDDHQQQQQQQQLVFKLESLGFPSDYKFGILSKEIVGSCNGLVCLHDNIQSQVSLWNPLTGEFRILPKTFIPSEDDVGTLPSLLAFCFDVETKDYKVMLLTRFRPEYYRPFSPIGCLCRVQVYSLITDSWRLLEGITSLPGDPFLHIDQVIYLNGSSSCCFFVAHFFHTKQQPCIPENDRFLISFDFTKEIITPIQLPDHHRDQVLYLSCLDDKLALFTVSYKPPRGTYYPEICGYEDYNIWVLDEHVSISSISSSNVNKKSWRKLSSFRIEHPKPGEWYIPRGISNDGEFALLQTRDSTGVGFGKKMKLYNFATKKVKKDFLPCSLVLSKAIAYKPSRHSIIGGKGEEEAAAAAAADDRLIGNGATNL